MIWKRTQHVNVMQNREVRYIPLIVSTCGKKLVVQRTIRVYKRRSA
jgi:hypothetical protein